LWAIAVLASLVILIALALCMPIDVVLRMDTEKKPKFSINIVWPFGLVNIEILKGGKYPPQHKHKPRDNFKTNFDILRTKGLLTRLIKLLRDILRCIKVRELDADLKVALDNPADTGLLFAFVAPLNLILRSFAPQKIRIEPSFDDTFLKGYFQGKARLQPIRLIPPLLAFSFSMPAMKVFKSLLSNK
jgi:hypothetical protein